jgi:hypothetical protein
VQNYAVSRFSFEIENSHSITPRSGVVLEKLTVSWTRRFPPFVEPDN